MLNFLVNLLFLLVIGYCVLFFGTQIMAIVQYIENEIPFMEWQLPTWNVFDIWGINWNTIILFVIGLIFLDLILSLLLKKNFFTMRRVKNKYQRENYFHLQGHFERKRGLNRIQYDRKGNITRRTLECLIEYLLRPLYVLQNAIMNYYNQPIYKKWNLQIKKIYHGDTEPIKTLNVFKGGQEKDGME